jgi:hypothetical protein
MSYSGWNPRCHSVNPGSVRRITGYDITPLAGFNFRKTLGQIVELPDNVCGVDYPASGPAKSLAALVQSDADAKKDQ